MNDLRGRDNPIQPNGVGKIIAALLVASAVAIAGIYGHETGALKSSPNQVVASQDLPSPTPLPKYVRSMTPPGRL